MAAHHHTSVADVPGESGHGPALRIHYRVLNDVSLLCHVSRQKLLRPARSSACFGQETSGHQTVVWSDFPKYDVFS